MPGLGTVYVELQLDRSKFNTSLQSLERDATSVPIQIEKSFQNLGIKSSYQFDLMRQKAVLSFDAIKSRKEATSNDILRAEKAMHAELAKIQEEQFGKQETWIQSLKSAWGSIAAPALASFAAISGAIVGLGYAAKSSLDTFQTLATQTRDLSFISGGTAEEVSGLIDVLDDFGVESSTVERAMVFLSKAVQEGSPSLDRLGISIRNSSGYLKTAHDLFYEVIDALKNTRSETERNAIAQELFSRGWTAMVPIIEKGADALRKAADASALAMSQEDLKRADQYRQTMADLSDQLEKIKLAVARGIVVPVTLMIKRYTEGPQVGDQYIDEFGLLNTRTAPEPADLSGTVRPGSRHYAPQTGPVQGPTPGEKKSLEEKEKLIQKMREEDRKGLIAGLEAQTKEYEDTLKLQGQMTDEYNKNVAAGRAADLKGLLEGIEATTKAYEDLLRLQGTLTDEQNKKSEETKKIVIESNIAQAESYADLMKEVGDAMEKYGPSAVLARDLEKLEAQFGSIFDSISNAFTVSFDSVIRGTQSVSDSFRKMGQSILLSISDMIIKQGLEMLKKKLFETLSPLIQAGASAVSAYFGGTSAATVPAAAEGGIVTRPTFAMVGEGGESEAIVPLSRAREFGFGGKPTVINIDARGAQRGVSAEVMQAIRQGMGQAVQVSLARVNDERRRGGMRGLDR